MGFISDSLTKILGQPKAFVKVYSTLAQKQVVGVVRAGGLRPPARTTPTT
ncbi:hypothetical protein [Ktedonobacter robiniae]|nr:hypothetical protein [Ktedonobacter robiniae]